MNDPKPEYFEHPFGIYKAVIKDGDKKKNVVYIAADDMDIALKIADEIASDLGGYINSLKWIQANFFMQGSEK